MVDTNCLQSKELEDFLSRSQHHIAVLTDYVGMEIVKASSDAAVRKNVSVLATFPLQVVVLKSTAVVCGLSGRRAGLSRRLIDHAQTSQFRYFCKACTTLPEHDARFHAEVQRMRTNATAHLNNLAVRFNRMPKHYSKFQSLFTSHEVSRIRSDDEFSSSVWQEFYLLVAELAEQLHQAHPQTKKTPTRSEWPNTFLYRSALFQGVHFMNWIRQGSPSQVSGARLLNDMIDMSAGVFATYFDGLLTKDRKALETHNTARHILEAHVLPHAASG